MRAGRQTIRCAVSCAASSRFSRRIFRRTLDRVHAYRAVTQWARLRIRERRVIVISLRIRKLVPTDRHKIIKQEGKGKKKRTRWGRKNAGPIESCKPSNAACAHANNDSAYTHAKSYPKVRRHQHHVTISNIRLGSASNTFFGQPRKSAHARTAQP